MCKDKKCSTCEYFGWDDFGRAHVCVNGDSEHVADFVSADDGCEHYRTRKITDDMAVVDLEGMKKWIQHQKECVVDNPECYTNTQDITDLLDIVEEYVVESSFSLKSVMFDKKENSNNKTNTPLSEQYIHTIDTKSMIFNLMKLKNTTRIKIKEYIELMKFIYWELSNCNKLRHYRMTFDVNPEHIQHTVELNGDILKLSLDESEVVLKKDIDLEKLINHYTIDYFIMLIVIDFLGRGFNEDD